MKKIYPFFHIPCLCIFSLRQIIMTVSLILRFFLGGVPYFENLTLEKLRIIVTQNKFPQGALEQIIMTVCYFLKIDYSICFFMCWQGTTEGKTFDARSN